MIYYIWVNVKKLSIKIWL